MPTLLDGDVLVSLTTTSCCNCGVVFAMPADLNDKRREDGQNFYCPNGHPLCYRRSEADRLREQLDRANGRVKFEADQREAAERSRRALRGVITKQRKRAAAGQCPCCDKAFTALADHMAEQHPDYAATDPEAVRDAQ